MWLVWLLFAWFGYSMDEVGLTAMGLFFMFGSIPTHKWRGYVRR